MEDNVLNDVSLTSTGYVVYDNGHKKVLNTDGTFSFNWMNAKTFVCKASATKALKQYAENHKVFPEHFSVKRVSISFTSKVIEF